MIVYSTISYNKLLAEWTPSPIEPKQDSKAKGRIVSGPKSGLFLFSRVFVPPQHSLEELRSEFAELARLWTEETILSSSIHEKCSHWAYQRIIGLGSDVVPLIMEEVQKGQRHWGWALSAITGENPAEHADSLKAAAEAWIVWNEERQFSGGRPVQLDRV